VPEANPAQRRQTPAAAGAERFEEFWAAYPRKIGKRDAERAWPAACRRTDAAKILDVLQRYPFDTDPERRRFIPYPATWLNQSRWEDDLEAVAAGNGHRPRSSTRSSVAPTLPARDSYTYGDGKF
jgi:hypothetical protein